jgi:molybdopterin-containing oxidoreductase family iron-sulfur binding subunit
MTKGMSRRGLLAGAGAALGAAVVGGRAARKALGAAGMGQPRWGIAVDVARCASRDGCRACIDACHAVHRVPALADPRHEIKWVWKEPFARVFPEQLTGYEAEARLRTPVLVLCNHCRKPACTKVCPTGATWRRSDGVVAMDQHRCIGCRYCMTACPYGARNFNWEVPKPSSSPGTYPGRTADVVEKCTLCVERVDSGQIPLCVETCGSRGASALTFGNLEDAGSPLRQLLASRQVLRRRPSLGTEPSVFYLV